MSDAILDETQIPKITKRRRALLPVWIKIFLWVFWVMSSLIPLGLVFGALGIPFSIALYGLETVTPISIVGLFLSLFFVLKWFTAFGLWTEKDWGVKLALIDGYVGIATCIFMMVVYPFLGLEDGFSFSFRLELFALFPYVIKMYRIQKEWIIFGTTDADLSA
ncbi:MAG: hypothetical protein ACJAU0_001680 [Flavobacteriales bacterium]|jgi:hypothetical protein